MEDYSIKLIQDLTKIINENPLPISIKYYIIKDLFNEIQNLYNQYLVLYQNQKEMEESEQEESIKVDVPLEDIMKKEE